MTKYTADIFEILRRGQFICSNSPDDKIQMLYRIMEEEGMFEQLSDYFSKINYILEWENEYFYFSRKEQTADLERKLRRAFEWIDILDFFKTYDANFDVGYRFTPSEIVSSLKNNADLKNKLEKMKGLGQNQKNYDERIRKLIDKLTRDNFIALELEISETYKVLNSFQYLKDLIQSINIPEGIENENPQ